MKYRLYIWYRYSIGNEQEKEYMDFDIEANSPKEAIIKSKELFPLVSGIPFKIECDGLTFKPYEL